MSVVMAACALVGVILVSGIGLYARAVTAAEHVRAGADQAALAAADALLNPTAGRDPCAVARALAARNSVQLTGCRVLSTSVQVETAEPAVLGRVARATARAGAPERAPR